MMERVKKRFLKRERKMLPMGGRLVLIKSIMTSLLIYFISFFLVPTYIISSMESFLIGVRMSVRYIG